MEIQRARIITAMAELVRERGVGGVAIAHVVTRSGVSRRTFYELFEGREACFRAALELAVERAAQRMLPAYRAADGWRERMRAGVGALLEFLEAEPDLGALFVMDALAAGPRALEQRARILDRLVDAVDEGRVHAKGSLQPTRLTAEGVVGGVLALIHARLAAGGIAAARNGESERIGGLFAPLMGMIVLPYLGPAAAGRETARPTPVRHRAPHASSNLLRDLNMRLTYRTVRVLLAIADRPGTSNREVADAAGVTDQGQISKLLARLEHLGLIENSGAGPSRGERNAWRLTPRGREIEHTIRRQTAPVDA